MPTTQEAKQMARALREALASRNITVTHSDALELVAKSLDYADWNTLAARASAAPPPASGSRADVDLKLAVPIIRIFDVEKAKAFYVDLLGFVIEWEHRFGEGYPLYMQVSRVGLKLHLSEHHGDATPGSAVYIHVAGLDALFAELRAKGSHASIEEGPGETRWLQVLDPFGNRLRFAERKADASATPEGYVVHA
jgi:catechol 2,3-dioxygenase-like lactoylglutathione lyase family enzyme